MSLPLILWILIQNMISRADAGNAAEVDRDLRARC